MSFTQNKSRSFCREYPIGIYRNSFIKKSRLLIVVIAVITNPGMFSFW